MKGNFADDRNLKVR